MGAMESHPILLCDNREENNKRPVYSWIMNNTWETNFKMDLSGFSEFRYGVVDRRQRFCKRRHGASGLITIRRCNLYLRLNVIDFNAQHEE